jgi:hypothetical protein
MIGILFGIWILGFGAYLEFGICDLEFWGSGRMDYKRHKLVRIDDSNKQSLGRNKKWPDMGW